MRLIIQLSGFCRYDCVDFKEKEFEQEF